MQRKIVLIQTCIQTVRVEHLKPSFTLRCSALLPSQLHRTRDWTGIEDKNVTLKFMALSIDRSKLCQGIWPGWPACSFTSHKWILFMVIKFEHKQSRVCQAPYCSLCQRSSVSPFPNNFFKKKKQGNKKIYIYF
jgi:hypothetical protein